MAGALPAQSLSIRRAEAVAGEVPVLQLAMQVELGARATDALEAGLVLAFDVDWELADGRRLRQSLALRFSPLLRSYQLAQGTAPPQAFALRNSLLSAMENARLRFADAKPCQGDCGGRVRVRLNPAALPAPLRVPALVDGDWDFDSGWRDIEGGAPGTGHGAREAAQRHPVARHADPMEASGWILAGASRAPWPVPPATRLASPP